MIAARVRSNHCELSLVEGFGRQRPEDARAPAPATESGMPRYFFDISDRSFHRDEEGSECEDFGAARELAMRSLPEIARFAIPSDGDNQAFVVLVRDEAGAVVYTATLTYAGVRLNGAANESSGLAASSR